jgi:WD40 repeat protein
MMKKRLIVWCLLGFILITGCQNKTDSIEIYPQLGHSDSVNAITYSPDGKWIASGSVDMSIQIWDAETGKHQMSCFGHTGQVIGLDWSPDGKYLVSCSIDKTIRAWAVESGEEVYPFPIPEEQRGFVCSVAYNPDGTRLVSMSSDGILIVWDTETHTPVLIEAMSPTPSYLVAKYSPDGRYIICTSFDDSQGKSLIFVINTDGFSLKKVLDCNGLPITTVACSPDGEHIAGGFLNGIIAQWDITNDGDLGELPQVFQAHDGRIWSIDYSPDGTRLISASRDNTVKVWNTVSGTLLKPPLERHNGTVFSAAFSPDGKKIASGSKDRTITIWDAENSKEIRTFSGNTHWVWATALSPDGKYLVSGSLDNTLMVWDTGKGREVKRLTEHTDRVYAIAFSPDEQSFVSGSWDGTIIKWDINGGTVYSVAVLHPDPSVKSKVLTVAYSHDGRYFVSGTAGGVIKLWDAISCKELGTLSGWNETSQTNTWSEVHAASFSPDDKYIILGFGDGIIKIIDFETWYISKADSDSAPGIVRANFQGHSGIVSSVAWSPDGEHIVSASWDNTAKVWGVSATGTGQEPVHTLSHAGYVNAVSYNADGSQIVSGSTDRTIRIWDSQSGELLYNLEGHRNSVRSVAFSHDGSRIVSGAGDGTTRLWDTGSRTEIIQFIGFINNEWIVITPDGYFNASPKGDAYLNIRVKGRVYSIDHFSLSRDRYKVVEARLNGLPDPKNIAISDLPPPDIAIHTPETSLAVTGENVELSVSINGEAPLKRINVYVNGRQVGRPELKKLKGSFLLWVESAGISVWGRQRQVNFRVPLNLDAGPNLIEVIATNTESEGIQTAMVHCTSEQPQPKPDIWILAIGANEYPKVWVAGKDKNGGETLALEDTAELNFAVKNAKDIVSALETQTKQGQRFGTVHYLLITDTDELKPTGKNIRDKLGYMTQAKPNDVVLLFISGHGETEESGQYFFVPPDAIADGYVQYQKAISLNDINKVLDVVPARKMIFLDTCYSGGGVDNDKLVRALKNHGTVIFTASQGTEQSFEYCDLKNSVFTYFTVKGLKGEAEEAGRVTVEDLNRYVSEQVSRYQPNTRSSPIPQHPYAYIPEGYRGFVLVAQDN